MRKSFNDCLRAIKDYDKLQTSLRRISAEMRSFTTPRAHGTPATLEQIAKLDAKMHQLFHAMDAMVEAPPQEDQDGTFHGTSLSFRELASPHRKAATACHCPPGDTQASCRALIHNPPPGYPRGALKTYTYYDGLGHAIDTKLLGCPEVR